MASSMFIESIELFVIMNEMHSLNSSDKVPDFVSLVSRMLGAIIYALVVGWKLALVFLSISPVVIITIHLTISVRYDHMISDCRLIDDIAECR
jgi:ABC-type multidrug transport system fused ATPase/permease subunit